MHVPISKGILYVFTTFVLEKVWYMGIAEFGWNKKGI
jgi:hypothetical protein